MPTSNKNVLRELYLGNSSNSLSFRLALLSFDLVTVLFFIISSLFEPSYFIYTIDYLIATIISADFAARISLEQDRKKLLFRLDTWLDITVILSLLSSMLIDNFSFLRVIRTLRLLRSYHLLQDLRQHFQWFRAHEDVIQSGFNLFVFIFFISACVYVLEHNENPNINNYIDALYYTVTTLTTTGFGDITLTDTSGRLLSIMIMIVGVSLFLRLVQTIFNPPKVLFPCPDCGLKRHDTDAVHCKHCGRVLNIESEGY
jgi:voltage-gated potassium channel